MAERHVDLAHLDAVGAGIADDLGGSVKAHRLRVQQAAAERVGMKMLQPGRDINELRKTRGVAFRETVRAETLDLIKTVFREFRIVAAPDHVAGHLLLEIADGADIAKRRHRTTQSVRLFRRKSRRLDRDPHRLLLKQGYAERLVQDLVEFVRRSVRGRRRRIILFLDAVPPPEIGMHHVTLDRAGPHNGNLDDEVIEFARFQSRQHVHLGAAFDLEDAERLAAAQHVVDFGDILRDRRELPALALVIGDQVEAFADAGQHAQRQHIDLHHFQGVDVVLVPFDESAVVHRGIADRHIGVEPVLREHIAADMLRQMPRKFDQLAGKLDREPDHGILRIGARLPHLHVVEALAPAAPHGIGQCGGDVFRQPQRLADVADRAARTIVNDGGNDRGAVAAVAAIDILHHLLTPRMFEVDVDVGRLQPFLGNEPLEQQIDLGRVDRGDAEHVADRGVRRRSPALAEDVYAARIADDVVHGEEIMRVVQLGDEVELLAQGGAERVVDLAGEILPDAGPCQVFQMLLRGLARRHRLIGILVFELVE